MTLNILWLSHLLPYPPIGGVRQRSYHLLKEVAEKNNVTLLALSQKAQQSNSMDIQKAVRALKDFCEEVHCFRMPMDQKHYGKLRLLLRSLITGTCYFTNWTQSENFKKKLYQLLKSKTFDLVYFDSIALAKYFNMLTTLPAALNHHNIESHLMYRRAASEKNLFIKAYCYQEAYKRKRLELRYCNKFDLNICVSELDKKRLGYLDKKIKKIEIVKNGVDPTRLWPPEKGLQEKKTLLFTGGMSRFPNRDAMLYFGKKIWPELKAVIPGIKIVIVGRKPPEKLKIMAKNDKNFILTGFVKEIKPYYDIASIYICPIRDGGGTRLKVLDAMASEKAIVSTPLCSEGIEAEDGREILIAKTADDFIAHIKNLLQNDKLRKNLGKNARDFVIKNYDFSIIGKYLNKYLEDIT